MAAATTGRKKTAKKTTARKAPARKKTAKKAPAKKASTPAPAHEPVQASIKGEMKYKLEAAQLRFNVEDARVTRTVQPELQRLLDRAKRNDRLWKGAAEARRDAINEFLDKEEKKLPEGYAIVNIDPTEGTYRAVYAPDRVDNRMQ